ncbi:MAG: PKD domain-containing protein [Myxococcales bacterium]|nr:PKD domain-containing protein [Myxococcales bacterium]
MRRLLLTSALALGACHPDTLPPPQGDTDASTGSTGAGPGSDGTASTGTTAAEVDTTASGDAGTTDGEPLLPDPGQSFYALVGEQVELDGSASTGAVLYSWDLDDGSEPTEPSPDPVVPVAYATPGRYHPVLTVFDAIGNQLAASVTVTVTEVPSHVPRHDATVARLADDARVAVVSPDSDELTIVGPAGENGFAVLDRLPTCARPRTAAALSDGRVAVACQDDDAVMVLDPDGGPSRSLALPYGARPYGVVADGSTLWVTLQARGELARVDASGDPLALEAMLPVIPDARGVAILPDGRVAVTRWRSPDDEAQLAVLDPSDGAVEPVTLAFDPKAPSDTESGGIPSYLDQLLVSPIGDRAVVPSLQANIGYGEYLADEALTFQTTLRGVISWLDLPGGGGAALEEDFERRKQLDNHGLLSAGVFSSRGDYLFVAARGSRAVERIDTFNGGQAGSLIDVGYAPSGLVLSADDRYLFVDAYLSRTLVVYDVSDFAVLPLPVETLTIPSAEPLSPELLRGKQLFNDSFDPRLAKDAYIACAHCHLDGEADRRTWDFSDRGEGLRNTIDLHGRGGTAHGPIHWSANFDEVQDFENDIRHAAQGLGLLDDADWNAGTTSQSLGDPKAGLSVDLDALAAYVGSLDQFPRSPLREPDGSMSPAALAGEALFLSPMLGCVGCHAGPRLTDSEFIAGDPVLHDVGTLTPASGQRLGGPLTGLDTPTLRGLWNGPPYLHDGSAATVLQVLTTHNPSDQHGLTSTLDAQQLDELAAYLLSLE